MEDDPAETEPSPEALAEYRAWLGRSKSGCERLVGAKAEPAVVFKNAPTSCEALGGNWGYAEG